MGEELILPLSGLGVKSPLTRISHLRFRSPFRTSGIQLNPVYLGSKLDRAVVYHTCMPTLHTIAKSSQNQKYYNFW